jgi:hypothetical protein
MDQQWARQRREFIRSYHPDRGGDPQAFIAGLARIDRMRRLDGRSHGTRVVVVARPLLVVRVLRALIRRFRTRPPRVR